MGCNCSKGSSGSKTTKTVKKGSNKIRIGNKVYKPKTR